MARSRFINIVRVTNKLDALAINQVIREMYVYLESNPELRRLLQNGQVFLSEQVPENIKRNLQFTFRSRNYNEVIIIKTNGPPTDRFTFKMDQNQQVCIHTEISWWWYWEKYKWHMMLTAAAVAAGGGLALFAASYAVEAAIAAELVTESVGNGLAAGALAVGAVAAGGSTWRYSAGKYISNGEEQPMRE